MGAARESAAKLKASKAREAEEARLKKEKEDKQKQDAKGTGSGFRSSAKAYDYSKYSASHQHTADRSNDYSKYSNYSKYTASQHGASSGGSSSGSQYVDTYSPAYAKYENASVSSGSQNNAGSGQWKKYLHGSSGNAGSQAAGGAQWTNRLSDLNGTVPMEQPAGHHSPMPATELLTETDSKVEDLNRRMKAIKQDQDAIKRYAPAEYQSEYLNRTNTEIAALEAQLKAAKQNATSSSATVNLLAAVGMDQTGWASESVYFCVIVVAVLLAWRFVGVLKSSSSNGFSSALLSAWLHLRRRVLKIDQRPLLEEFGVQES